MLRGCCVVDDRVLLLAVFDAEMLFRQLPGGHFDVRSLHHAVKILAEMEAITALPDAKN